MVIDGFFHMPIFMSEFIQKTFHILDQISSISRTLCVAHVDGTSTSNILLKVRLWGYLALAVPSFPSQVRRSLNPKSRFFLFYSKNQVACFQLVEPQEPPGPKNHCHFLRVPRVTTFQQHFKMPQSCLDPLHGVLEGLAVGDIVTASVIRPGRRRKSQKECWGNGTSRIPRSH